MRKFVARILMFVSILFLVFLIGIFLPATPRSSTSLLFAKKDKDSLLANVKSPRIILIGGSNLSFGINSQMIKDSLKLNPINTSIHACIGLVYMMDITIDYIKKGDYVILSPEYDQYYGTFAYGGEELLRTILDVSPASVVKLKIKQLFNIYRTLIKYSFSKFEISEYYGFSESDLYSASSFNYYGDVYRHWGLTRESFELYGSIGDDFNYSIISEMICFKKKLQAKGATLFVTFPGYQASSFELSRKQILKVESELKKNKFTLLGTPERYKMPDSMMFNTPYHLLKVGVDYRTNLLIHDIKTRIRKP